MQINKLSTHLALIAGMSVSGAFDDLGCLAGNRKQQDFTVHPHQHLNQTTMSKIGLSEEQKALFDNPNPFQLHSLKMIRDGMVIDVNNEQPNQFVLYYIKDLTDDILKFKTSVYRFKGEPDVVFYKRLMMYIYMTSGKGLKDLLLRECFSVTSAPAGLSAILEKMDSGLKGAFVKMAEVLITVKNYKG